MSSRIPLAAVPSDAVARREPSLSAEGASTPSRLGSRARPTPPLELRAGERAIVASVLSSVGTSSQRPDGWSLTAKVALGIVGLFALFGAVMMVRLFVGV
jgi:hypothetical protein